MSRLAIATLVLGALACTSEDLQSVDASAPLDAMISLDAAGGTTEDAGEVDLGGDAGPADAGGPPTVLGGNRPARLVVPSGYDGTPHPLLILLHGYSATAAIQDQYLGVSTRADRRGLFIVLPDGTPEAGGRMPRFWNATAACCNFGGVPVDDVAYLTGLIDEAGQHYNIDPRRVYLYGHSNGGFMAYRMACDAAPRIAAIASLAGATHFEASDCAPTEPVSVLQIHGTADATILYEGVPMGFMQYPGAEETTRRWADRAGCSTRTPSAAVAQLDLDRSLMGDDTDVFAFANCASGLGVELWRINMGGHIPAVQPDFSDQVLDFLLAHPKPE